MRFSTLYSVLPVGIIVVKAGSTLTATANLLARELLNRADLQTRNSDDYHISIFPRGSSPDPGGNGRKSKGNQSSPPKHPTTGSRSPSLEGEAGGRSRGSSGGRGSPVEDSGSKRRASSPPPLTRPSARRQRAESPLSGRTPTRPIQGHAASGSAREERMLGDPSSSRQQRGERDEPRTPPSGSDDRPNPFSIPAARQAPRQRAEGQQRGADLMRPPGPGAPGMLRQGSDRLAGPLPHVEAHGGGPARNQPANPFAHPNIVNRPFPEARRPPPNLAPDADRVAPNLVQNNAILPGQFPPGLNAARGQAPQAAPGVNLPPLASMSSVRSSQDNFPVGRDTPGSAQHVSSPGDDSASSESSRSSASDGSLNSERSTQAKRSLDNEDNDEIAHSLQTRSSDIHQSSSPHQLLPRGPLAKAASGGGGDRSRSPSPAPSRTLNVDNTSNGQANVRTSSSPPSSSGARRPAPASPSAGTPRRVHVLRPLRESDVRTLSTNPTGVFHTGSQAEREVQSSSPPPSGSRSRSRPRRPTRMQALRMPEREGEQGAGAADATTRDRHVHAAELASSELRNGVGAGGPAASASGVGLATEVLGRSSSVTLSGSAGGSPVHPA